MGMVVVKARAVRQHEITFHLMKRKRPMCIELGELVLFFVLRKTRHAESPRVFVWIFTSIIPAPLKRGRQMRANELHGLDDRIDLLEIVPRDPIFRFNSKQPSHISPQESRAPLDNLVHQPLFRLSPSPERRDAYDLFWMMVEQLQPFFRYIVRR